MCVCVLNINIYKRQTLKCHTTRIIFKAQQMIYNN